MQGRLFQYTVLRRMCQSSSDGGHGRGTDETLNENRLNPPTHPLTHPHRQQIKLYQFIPTLNVFYSHPMIIYYRFSIFIKSSLFIITSLPALYSVIIELITFFSELLSIPSLLNMIRYNMKFALMNNSH